MKKPSLLVKRRRLVSAMAALTFGLSAMLGFLAAFSSEGTDNAVRVGPPATCTFAFTVHDPINIDGNAGFTNASGVVRGSGTESDPYIIEGWDISAATATGIQIQNTTARFIVRFCSVSDGAAMMVFNPGIYLRNCTNGTLDNNNCLSNENGIRIQSSLNIALSNNTCFGNRGYGIYLDSSRNNTLTNNTCISNSGWGIFLGSSNDCVLNDNKCSVNTYGMDLLSSSNNTLTHNNCSSNDQSGIGLYLSNYNTLSDNICSSNPQGITVGTSSNNTLSRNNCTNDESGIFLYGSSNNTLSRNNCSSNDISGIYLSSSNNNTLNSNDCSENGNGTFLYTSRDNTLNSNNCSNNYYGAFLEASDNNVMVWNLVRDNLGYGVYVYSDSSFNTISHNTFMDNNGAGSTYDSSHVQAIDDGTGNWWNGTDGNGNYWSDWTTPDENHDGIVDLPYNISGSAGAKDLYPLTTVQTQIPEFGMIPILVIALLIAVPLMRRPKRGEAR